MTRPKPLAERFWPKVDKNGPVPQHRPELGQCWIWTAGRNRLGYGRFWRSDGSRLAYRTSYELLVGPVSSDLELDHLCKNTSCVNPDHLEAVTHRVNVERGDSPVAKHMATDRCPQGHPYTADNLVGGRESRDCKACHRTGERARQGRSRGLARQSWYADARQAVMKVAWSRESFTIADVRATTDLSSPEHWTQLGGLINALRCDLLIEPTGELVRGAGGNRVRVWRATSRQSVPLLEAAP